MTKDFQDISKQYFNRFPDFSLAIDTIPKIQNLRTIIVIPCFKEPEILKTLASLAACDVPKYETLVLILVNASQTASEEIKNFNQNTFNEVSKFIENNKSKNLSFSVLINQEMPEKHAGVGYARKTLMDTALRVFEAKNSDGIIVNTDADCFFTPNYFNSIENAFENENLKFAVMHYAHRIEEEPNPIIAKGITEYELHLRYYKQALEWTEYPNVLETIGSCMVCLASVYALEGGMNKRKAAEDFYFINKLAKNNQSTTIKEATVMPSCRTSDRVPFGTGKAMNDYVEEETEAFQTYDFECFILLRQFIEQLEVLYEKGFQELELDKASKAFFEKIDIENHLKEIKKQSNSFERFKNRFFDWFDHLKALQFIHFQTDNAFKKVPITIASKEFLNLTSTAREFENTYEILLQYRKNEIEPS